MITFGQYVANRVRLKHELFEKRVVVYDVITQYLANVLTSGQVETGQNSSYWEKQDVEHSETPAGWTPWMARNYPVGRVASPLGTDESAGIEQHTVDDSSGLLWHFTLTRSFS